MTREDADFIGAMNMCDEISDEVYKKIMCHCEGQEPCDDAISRKWVLDVVKNFVFDTETDRNRIIHIVRDTAPSVTPKEKQDPILDKIRAEIRHFMYDVNPSSSESDYACDYILDVIDKYRAESEEKTNG